MAVGNAFLGSLLEVLYVILNFYVWMIIVGAVLSWLIAFNVVNPYNRFVQVVGQMTSRITEPLLVPLRRLIPPIGGMDLSPMALIFIIWFLQAFIRRLAF